MIVGRQRDWLSVGASLLLAVGAGVGLVEIFLLPSAQRNDVIGFWGFTLALAGAVASVVGWLRRLRRPMDARPVNILADLLAQGVYGQWRKAATERVLLTPPPIPVRWSLSSLPVTGELTAALDGPFDPLPGLPAVTEAQLRAGGGRRELFEVYAGLASGRIVVVGAPGSGKSGYALLLLLDALEHRKRLDDDTERTQVPVPVLFTVHGWDPAASAVGDWLADQLAATYPLFQHRGGYAEVSALVTAGAIALILDRLDEMDPAMRPAALRALSDAPFRVVVLTRSQEMVQATSDTWLAGAAAPHLRNVTGPEGADYLMKARTGPLPSGWSQLLTCLRESPDDSILTRGLSSPLALTLVRDTYRASDDVSELLNLSTCGTAKDLERYLIARVLPAAYAPRPGRSKPRYSLPHATQALTFLAREMNRDNTRDLAWWNVPRWAPIVPRVLAGMLASGFLGIILLFFLAKILGRPLTVLGVAIQGHESTGPASGWPTLLALGLGIGLLYGAWYSRGGRAPKKIKNWRSISVALVPIFGLLYGVGVGFVIRVGEVALVGLVHGGPVYTLVVGLAFGLLARPSDVFVEGQKRSQSLRESWRHNRVAALLFGAVFGLATFFGFRYEEGNDAAAIEAAVTGLAAGLLYWVLSWLAVGLATRVVEAEDTVPLSPRESWLNDRVVEIVVGMVFGLAVGVGYGLGGGLYWLLVNLAFGPGQAPLRDTLASGLIVGIVAGLVAGLLYGITSSSAWPAALAWLQLRCSRRIPAVSLMRFLEDARARGVLRTVGAVYQFRHATLQDYLAGVDRFEPLGTSRQLAR
jgi:hypothetical protein